MSAIEVRALLGELDLQIEPVAGVAGLDRLVANPRIQRPGLALAGYTPPVKPERVQVLGYSEVSFLRTLDEMTLRRRAEALCALGPACLVVTRGLEVPDGLRAAGDKFHVPILRTTLTTSTFTSRAAKFLEAAMSPWTNLHGVMVDVFGVGIVLLGKSGIGKSEAALDLVLRGHRLVADDIVDMRLHPPATVVGSAAEMIKHHMEIRGLGIIDIEELFGAAAVRDSKKVELVVEMVEWDPDDTYDRVGVEELRYPILGVEIPLLRVPVHPGRNVTTLIEVAARNFLLKARGVDSARTFEERLSTAIRAARSLTPPPMAAPAARRDEVE